MARLKASLTRLVKLSMDPMELIDDSAAYARLRELASRPGEVEVGVERVFVRAVRVEGGVALVVRGWSLQPAVTVVMEPEEAKRLVEEVREALGG